MGVWFYLFILGSILNVIGVIWILALACVESFFIFLLCILVPFFLLFYAAVSFPLSKRPFWMMIIGSALMIISLVHLIEPDSAIVTNRPSRTYTQTEETALGMIHQAYRAALDAGEAIFKKLGWNTRNRSFSSDETTLS